MDDLDFRRRIYADPTDQSADIQDACTKDESKAKFRADVQKFDKQLHQALSIPAPENLTEKVLLGQSIAIQHAERRKNNVYLALVASVAFTVGAFFQFGSSNPAFNQLSDHAIAHMTNEMSHIPTSADYTLPQLNAKLAGFGATLTKSIAPIKFANFCKFDGTTSLHLVFATDQGDVTVFVVPQQSQLKVIDEFKTLDFVGKTIQTQQANIVVITDKQTNAANEWANKLEKSISWQQI